MRRTDNDKHSPFTTTAMKMEEERPRCRQSRRILIFTLISFYFQSILFALRVIPSCSWFCSSDNNNSQRITCSNDLCASSVYANATAHVPSFSFATWNMEVNGANFSLPKRVVVQLVLREFERIAKYVNVNCNENDIFFSVFSLSSVSRLLVFCLVFWQHIQKSHINIYICDYDVVFCCC